MKTANIVFVTVLMLSLISCGFSQTAEQTQTNLNEEEIQNLQWMVEEEKLASDVYMTLYEIWGLQPFYNIGAQSEVQHTMAVSNLLNVYGIENPSSDTRGVFANPDLQTLYNKLMAQGQQSLEQALYVGATIEEVDIVDLQRAISATKRADVIQVYENLMKGSRNHLRAFMNQISQRGFSYTAQYLDEETFNQIINSPMEQGSY